MSVFLKLLITCGVSALPVLELRAAIPIGLGYGLPWWQAYISAVIGNMLPVPFIILFCTRVFAWLRKLSSKFDSFVAFFEKKAEKKSDVVRKYSMMGLCILVAIPLPATGAWTGSLVAAVLGLKLRDAWLPVLLGVLIAGVIVTLISLGVFTAVRAF